MASTSSTSLMSSRTVLAAFLAGLLGACATQPPAGEPFVAPTAPAALAPTEGERASFAWHAIGTQIYECKASDKGGFNWVFVAPEADLYNQKKEKIGTHGAGPFWAALDGSQILGTVKARANAPQAADIPLLLLSTKSNGSAGKMARVSSVQRLNTVGGIAPATGCAAATDAGKRVKEAYTADYVFFEPK